MNDDIQFAEVDGRRIAFRHLAWVGGRPTFVFLPGYMSDMAGAKAGEVWAYGDLLFSDCLLLDYSGCGKSEGDFADGSLSRWRDEVLGLLELRQITGKVILVGSSMGGWLMLLIGRELGDRLVGMVGIAAAPDFSDWGYDDAQKARLRAGETVYEANPYGPDPTPTHSKFWQDAETHKLLGGSIPIRCPVRLLHGSEDADVPPEVSRRLASALDSNDVRVTIVDGGDHRLSRDTDLRLLGDTLQELAFMHR